MNKQFTFWSLALLTCWLAPLAFVEQAQAEALQYRTDTNILYRTGTV